MFKMFKNIKLRKLINVSKNMRKCEYIILFKNDTYKNVYSKFDLIWEIEQDTQGKIYYIFDMADRIILDKEIVVEKLKEVE